MGGVTLYLFLDTWVTCYVVKRLSAVVKAVSKCMSLVVLYVFSLTDSEVEPTQLATVLVIMATTCYFLISVQQRRLMMLTTSATVALLATTCFAFQQGFGRVAGVGEISHSSRLPTAITIRL